LTAQSARVRRSRGASFGGLLRGRLTSRVGIRAALMLGDAVAGRAVLAAATRRVAAAALARTLAALLLDVRFAWPARSMMRVLSS
jgi:hypothetical protein